MRKLDAKSTRRGLLLGDRRRDRLGGEDRKSTRATQAICLETQERAGAH